MRTKNILLNCSNSLKKAIYNFWMKKRILMIFVDQETQVFSLLMMEISCSTYQLVNQCFLSISLKIVIASTTRWLAQLGIQNSLRKSVLSTSSTYKNQPRKTNSLLLESAKSSLVSIWINQFLQLKCYKIKKNKSLCNKLSQNSFSNKSNKSEKKK